MIVFNAPPAMLARFAAVATLAMLAVPKAGVAQTVTPPTIPARAETADPAGSVAPAAGNLQVGRITGVGGIFFRSRDPKALMAWYRDVLGLKVEDWGGVVMAYDAPRHPPAVTVTAFAETAKAMAPSRREFMVNFGVDDLDAFLARITAKGASVLGRDDSDRYGRFAWILDPDGTKIELYEPRSDQPVD